MQCAPDLWIALRVRVKSAFFQEFTELLILTTEANLGWTAEPDVTSNLKLLGGYLFFVQHMTQVGEDVENCLHGEVGTHGNICMI